MLAVLARLRSVAAECTDTPVWSVSRGDLVTAVVQLDRVRRSLLAVQLGLLRALDEQGVAVAEGASSTAVWLREKLLISHRAARQLVALATAIDGPAAAVQAALMDGRVNGEQAQVIAEVVTALPADLGPAVADKAAAALLELAQRFEPMMLRRLGSRILDHVAPQLADERDRKALEAQETRATARRALSMTADPHLGGVFLRGYLDAEDAATVSAALDPLCRPDPVGDGGPDRSPVQRRADALVDVCRLAMQAQLLPQHGGDRTQLVVTVAYDPLTRQLGPGLLDNGATLTPESVRRLGCDARVLPAILGGHGQVLDLGRERRLVTGNLRRARALVLRDGGCAFPGCDRPARWADAHHIRHWSHGGVTSLDNSVLLCGHHHRVLHHHDWTVRLGPDRRPEFVPPRWIDPSQRPRRNTYHRTAILHRRQ